MDNEHDFIQRLKHPNTKEVAYKELLSLYKERLYWHIRHIVKSHHDADDVLQNTFIKVYKNVANFKGDATINTIDGAISINTDYTIINAISRNGRITKEIIDSGEAILNLKSVNGNITITKTKN